MKITAFIGKISLFKGREEFKYEGGGRIFHNICCNQLIWSAIYVYYESENPFALCSEYYY